jgi:hypothetical protein
MPLISPPFLDVYGYFITCLKGSSRKFDAERREFFAPQDFSPFFGEKLPKSSEITHMVTSNGGHPLHHHKGLRQAVQLPLQQKNHQANLHTVAASLHTVVLPPVAF